MNTATLPASISFRTETTETTEAKDTCLARLRELIMDADLLPNSHHLVGTLAHRLDVDERAFVSAAMRLEEEGFLTREPRGGFWVNCLSPAEVTDAFRQVSTLEARAAFVAALHSPSSVGMAALDDSVLRMEDALYRRDLDQWAQANQYFHRSIVQCSGHTGLIDAARQLSEPIHRARMLALRLGPLPTDATKNYGRVVRAIHRGLATDARDIHLASWRSAADRMVTLLEANRLHSWSA